jgi:hypothetical protein
VLLAGAGAGVLVQATTSAVKAAARAPKYENLSSVFAAIVGPILAASGAFRGAELSERHITRLG